MSALLVEAREKHYENAVMIKKLRAMLQSTEDNARMLKKQSTFLSQLAAKTVPKGLHCFSMRLTVEYHTLSSAEQEFERKEKLEDPDLYHYALFSDNILAAAVVVNSTILNAKVQYLWIITKLFSTHDTDLLVRCLYFFSIEYYYYYYYHYYILN